MNLFPEHISLNEQKISVAEFLETSPKSELKNFLSEWYSPKSFIEAKTSGSTGKPKTIRLAKDFVAKSAQRTIQFFRLNQGDRILQCLPIKFIAGKLMVIRALIGGLNLNIVEPETDFSFLQTEKFRFAAMVPTQVNKILESESTPGAWLQNLEQLLIGGSAIPFVMEQKLQAISTACCSSYAMTETATHIALRKINGEDADDFYHCLEDIHVQLSENGCLQIFMPGLAKQPLQTTDLAELKNEKTFRILGRSDNVIISGGIKYSPEQIEKKLEPFIEIPFLISSLPHESLGEQIVLVLESLPLTPPKEGGLSLPQVSKIENTKIVNLLKNICQQQLTKYEQPRHILFIQRFPQVQNNKIDRKILQQNLKNTSTNI
jgi:O-succinylbenzoic acid--CoA ligase